MPRLKLRRNYDDFLKQYVGLNGEKCINIQIYLANSIAGEKLTTML